MEDSLATENNYIKFNAQIKHLRSAHTKKKANLCMQCLPTKEKREDIIFNEELNVIFFFTLLKIKKKRLLLLNNT